MGREGEGEEKRRERKCGLDCSASELGMNRTGEREKRGEEEREIGDNGMGWLLGAVDRKNKCQHINGERGKETETRDSGCEGLMVL